MFVKVTGEANEKQILEALKRYVLRAVYVQKSLYTLFRLTQVMVEPREDIIRVSVQSMAKFPCDKCGVFFSSWVL